MDARRRGSDDGDPAGIRGAPPGPPRGAARMPPVSRPRRSPSLAALGLALALAACSQEAPPPPGAAAARPAGSADATGDPGTNAALAGVRALGYAGDLDAAAEALGRARADGAPPAQVALVESELARLADDADGAVAAAERAVELAPDSGAAHHALARALTLRMRGGMLAAMGSLPAFKRALRRALELDPSNVDAHADWIGFLALVPGVAGGDRDRALELARELQALDERRGLVLTSFVQSLREEPGDALATLDVAAERFPDDAEVHATRGMILASEERLDEAREAFEAALAGARDRHHYQALYQLAKLRIEAGVELEEALAAMRRYADEAPLADLLPPRAGAHWRAGQALVGLGRTDEARAAFERALELQPGFEQAREDLEALGD